MSTLNIAILYVLTIVNALFIWLIFRKITFLTQEMRAKFNELNINAKISDIFSHNIDQDNINSLASSLIKRLHKQYDLKSTAYTDLVTEIRHTRNMDETLREALIDFFEHIVLISYKEEAISDHERTELKKKLRLIINMFQTKGI